jgi:hypothetical protein
MPAHESERLETYQRSRCESVTPFRSLRLLVGVGIADAVMVVVDNLRAAIRAVSTGCAGGAWHQLLADVGARGVVEPVDGAHIGWWRFLSL